MTSTVSGILTSKMLTRGEEINHLESIKHGHNELESHLCVPFKAVHIKYCDKALQVTLEHEHDLLPNKLTPTLSTGSF